MNKPYIEDQWNPWTVKSRNIDFKSAVSAIGDGEHKLAKEFGKNPLGQNSAYDLEVYGEKWEIKKCDADNSFRLGVEVATHYTPVISSVIRIIENVLSLKHDLVNSESGIIIQNCIKKIETISPRCKTLLLDGLRKNEVSESNLKKANNIIEELKLILIQEDRVDEKVKLYSSVNGKIYDYNYLISYKKISLENISVSDKIKILGNEETYNRSLITSKLENDLMILKDLTLVEKLNEIIRIVFKDVRLVLVHKNLGYKPLTNLTKIYCNRITSGLPRCKLL